ncbi:MAG TPA: stage V sporulation protein T, partial [Clostridiaceae bacterium]|nr:stage V sporulation protein T [Clostridiaceae bacterium]
IILSKEADTIMGDTERKLAETAAGFLGKQMEQ